MSRPNRLDPSLYVGLRQYFLTICTCQQACYFSDAATVGLVLAQILRVATEEHFEILAYCFMPDHLHGLVAARSETANLQRFVRLAKQRSGFLFVQAAGRRLWQESYYERVVRSDGSLPTLIEYIIRNPVRAGLVNAPAEYPHWGSQTCSREEILGFIGTARRV